jgi:hypothetical protein
MQPNVSRNKHGEVNGNRGLNHNIGRQHGPGAGPKLGKTMASPKGVTNFKGSNTRSPNGGSGTPGTGTR